MARKKSTETIDAEIAKVMADMSKLQDSATDANYTNIVLVRLMLMAQTAAKNWAGMVHTTVTKCQVTTIGT